MKKLKFLVIMIVILILILGNNTFFNTQAIETSAEQVKHEAAIGYKVINNQVLIPFGVFMNLVGISNVKWEPRKGVDIAGRITVEVPGVLDLEYASNLIRGLGPREEEGIEKVPSVLNKFIEDSSTPSSNPTNNLQTKRIDIAVNSQGFRTGYVTYNYDIVDRCIYINPEELKGFGFQELKIDQETNCAIVTYYTPEQLTEQAKEKVAPIEDIIKKLEPEEIVSLWIRGQQTRSGALQYSLLCDELRYKVREEAKTRGWITGGSSPTLLHGKDTVMSIDKISEDEYVYTIQYESMLQGQVYEILKQTVNISRCREKHTNYWCITQVIGDVGYYTFESVSK